MSRWANLRRHLSTFLTALILAVAVWVSAVLDSDPNQTAPYPRTVPLEVRNLGADLMLLNARELPAIRFTLRAPQSLWERLRSEENSVHAWIDLSGLSAGTHRVAVHWAVDMRPVQVVQFSPQIVEVTLDRRASRTLPVTVERRGEVALGYFAGPAVVTPDQVTLSGPASLLQRVARVVVAVDLNNTRETIRKTLRPIPYDEDGLPVTGLEVEPESVTLTIPVQQLGGYRDVAVKVVLRGQVANGYRITNVTVSPPVVTVFSDNPELVRALPGFVETEPLDISGATDDIETRLALDLPPGVSLVGQETVLVQVSIAAIEGSVTFSVPVEVAGLGPGLVATLSPEEVDVLLSGPLPVLDNLALSALRVVVDLSGLGPGVHQVAPQVEVLAEGVRVEAVNPGAVEVTITAGATPSPAPTP